MNKTFTLYSSLGCHLCEQALAMCQQLNLTEQVQLVDIVDDDRLVAQYGIHIPVLKRNCDQQELFWPFTRQQISELL
jgi:hypothetical protein